MRAAVVGADIEVRSVSISLNFNRFRILELKSRLI